MSVSYIKVGQTYSGVINGKPFTLSPDHMNYTAVVKALQKRQGNQALKMFNVKQSLKKYVSSSKRIRFDGENFYYRGKPIHDYNTEQILQLMKAGEPFVYMVKFLENCYQNPNPDSVVQLLKFLQHGNMPITEDGCFLTYKSVNKDYKDHHTNTYDNRVGKKPKMKRSDVDPNPNAACSCGFHVGSFNYADTFASQESSHLMCIKVNPKNCVSVPTDHSHAKLRVCEYEVISEIKDRAKLEGVVSRADKQI